MSDARELFVKSVKEQVPMLRMLSHMGIQDNQIQTDLRSKFMKTFGKDLDSLERVRRIARSLKKKTPKSNEIK